MSAPSAHTRYFNWVLKPKAAPKSAQTRITRVRLK